MSKSARGGLTLKTGKIGRVNCLRQQILMPGERMNIGLNGKIRLETLRERDVMRINAHLGVFMTPLRWLWPEFPDFLKEGPNGTIVPPAIQGENSWDKLGVGAHQSANEAAIFKWWQDAYLRVYNEWYKWPEGDDSQAVSVNGEKAVPLSTHWSRCRKDASPEGDDKNLDTSSGEFDIRDLAETQARYRSAMKRDHLSYNRWMELIDETYKGDGSREVDQVPIMIDQVDVGVNPREMAATDGASLGQWQSMFDFGVDHNIRGVVAPEHCVLTYMLTVRFAAVTENCHPLATVGRNDWWDITADPEYLSVEHPRQVQLRDMFMTDSTTDLGYLPGGWKWRAGHDVIGRQIDARDSFPMMNEPTDYDTAKDATRIKDAFRSQALDDYIVDVYIDEESNQPTGTAMDSYFAGMLDEAQPSSKQTNDEFPKGGKML